MEVKKILCIDDEKSNLTLLTHLLTREGFQVDTCLNGIEGIEKVRNNNYSVVLLDVLMPLMDGYETCRKIVELKPDIPIIHITALNDDANLQRSFESGAVEYINKPFSILELVTRVKKIIQHQEKEKEIKSLYSSLLMDIKLATTIQKYLLPKWVYSENSIILSSMYNPSRNVGGDVYDYIKISENKYVVYIGDISGKGIQAALLMTAVKSIISMLIERNKENFQLEALVTELNNKLSISLFSQNFMTLLFGVIDLETKTFSYLNAGHPPLIKINCTTGKVSMFDDSGTVPIGWKEDLNLTSDKISTVQLNDQCVYMLYTDGIFECVNKDDPNDLLGLDRLINLIENYPQKYNVINLPYFINDSLSQLGYLTNSDDFTVIAFQSGNEVFVDDKFTDYNLKVINFSNLKQNSANIYEDFKSVFSDNYWDIFDKILLELLNPIVAKLQEQKEDTHIAIFTAEKTDYSCFRVLYRDVDMDNRALISYLNSLGLKTSEKKYMQLYEFEFGLVK